MIKWKNSISQPISRKMWLILGFDLLLLIFSSSCDEKESWTWFFSVIFSEKWLILFLNYSFKFRCVNDIADVDFILSFLLNN